MVDLDARSTAASARPTNLGLTQESNSYTICGGKVRIADPTTRVGA